MINVQFLAKKKYLEIQGLELRILERFLSNLVFPLIV